MEDRTQHRADVAAGLRKRLRRALDECVGRRVGHIARHEFLGDVARRRRMMRERVNDFFRVVDAPARGEIDTEYAFGAIVVSPGIENKRASLRVIHSAKRPGALIAANRPTGKGARQFLHVFLGVTPVRAERVQLHDLARIILVGHALDVQAIVQVL